MNPNDHIEKHADNSRENVFDALAAAGITRVKVDFDGIEDDGQIEGIEAFAGERAAETPKCDEFDLQEAIEEICFDHLEETHGG